MKKRFGVLISLLLFGILLYLPCSAADKRMDALADGSASVASTWYAIGYSGTTPYRFTLSSALALALPSGSEGNILKYTGGAWTASDTLTATITPLSVDGSAHVHLTAAQVTGTIITNYGQAAADVVLQLPAAKEGMNFLAEVGTARSNHWGVQADTNDKIYLVASDGTVTAGDDNAAVVMTAAQVGQSFACWTFQTGAASYDWKCKAIAIGTSTFAAHAGGF